MILQASQTIIKFEDGDIGVGFRAENGIGEIAFQDIEKTEIGKELKDDKNIFPVRLIFKKKESIDVIIEALNIIKNKM